MTLWSIATATRTVRLAFTTFALALTIPAWGGSAVQQAPSSALLGCRPGSAEHRVEVTGRLFLHQGFLAASGAASPAAEARAIDSAIALQLRFVGGYFQNDPLERARQQVTLGALHAPIEILSRKTAGYPFDLVVDSYRWHAEPYVQAAIKAGQAHKGDPAIEVVYRTQLELAVCGHKPGGEALPPSAFVPLDPHLAIWFVRPEKRRPRRYRHFFSLASPCATAEMAEFGSSGDFWYLWDPRAEGIDEEGYAFNCQDIAPIKTYTHELKLSPKLKAPSLAATRSFAQSAATRPAQKSTLRVTAIFGHMSYERFRQLDLVDYARRLGAIGGKWDDFGEKFWRSQLDPKKRETIYEPGAMEMLSFMRHVKNVLEIKSVRIEPAAPGSLVFRIEGTLPKSRRPASVRVYYGKSQIFDGDGRHPHWKVLLDAFENDDVIAYNGHAGLGNNLKLSVLEEKLGVPEARVRRALERKPYQIFALFSCYSYSHFGEDIFAMRARRTTDMLLSGTKDAGAKYVLGLMNILDRNELGSQVDLQAAIGRYLGPRDFVVYKRQEP